VFQIQVFSLGVSSKPPSAYIDVFEPKFISIISCLSGVALAIDANAGAQVGENLMFQELNLSLVIACWG
jgi:hypothetical protein